ncbi:hypothetical protein CES87_19680 [Pseudomonas sp. ERMR1:02]|nr:hypothetical protein CES87_19680 [Pseudomonas sp. ERMR1:02]
MREKRGFFCHWSRKKREIIPFFFFFQHREYIDSASRIEAANDLMVSAGRDITSTGSVLSSGRGLQIARIRKKYDVCR